MKKGIAMYILIISILIGGITYAYFYFEKPMQEKVKNSQISMNIYATENSKNVITGYKILIDDNLYKNGTTLKDSLVSIEAIFNSTFVIYNYNLKDQTYYSYLIDENTYLLENKRINLLLEKSYPLVIKRQGNFDGSIINLNLTSENFKGLNICIKWSVHVIYSNLESNISELKRIENPEEYKYYDKCYSSNYNLNNSNNYSLDLIYKYYDILNEDDFIDIVFFDTNCVKNNCFSTRNQTLFINNI